MSSRHWVPKAWGLTVALIGLSFVAGQSLADEATEAHQEPIAVGQQAPEFTLTGSDGETYDSSTLRGEKNLLMIFFRGTW